MYNIIFYILLYAMFPLIVVVVAIKVIILITS